MPHARRGCVAKFVRISCVAAILTKVLRLSLPILVAGAAPAANEEQLKSVWDAHLASPQAHAQSIAACNEFARKNPGDPLLPVVQDILAWHLLSAGDTAAALDVLKPQLAATGTDPVTPAARRIASAWTTRAVRGKVVEALQQYYRKKIAYPASLADLVGKSGIPDAARPPMQDVFGVPWKYRLTGFKNMQGFENQRYSLQSETLGETSDLSVALKIPYASGIAPAPERVLDETPPKVILRSGAGTGLLVPGQDMGGVSLAFVGRKIVLLANHSYWKLFPRP